MLKLRKTAITGGIACGKSSVAQIFNKLGAYVVSADEIVHWHLSNNRDLIKMVGKLLGPDVIIEERVDRNAVAKKVFSNPKLLKSLEKLVHPLVKKDIDEQFLRVEKEGKAPLFAAEIPVLFEAGGNKPFFDSVIVVDAPEELCRKRYAGNDFDQRMSCQIPMEEKLNKADYVIINDQTFDHLEKQVETIYKKLTKS